MSRCLHPQDLSRMIAQVIHPARCLTLLRRLTRRIATVFAAEETGKRHRDSDAFVRCVPRVLPGLSLSI